MNKDLRSKFFTAVKKERLAATHITRETTRGALRSFLPVLGPSVCAIVVANGCIRGFNEFDFDDMKEISICSLQMAALPITIGALAWLTNNDVASTTLMLSPLVGGTWGAAQGLTDIRKNPLPSSGDSCCDMHHS